jgi:ferredoxin
VFFKGEDSTKNMQKSLKEEKGSTKRFSGKRSEKQKGRAMKVVALRNRCIASGACTLAASQVFDQRESDGVVELLQEHPSLDQLQQVRQAIAACPSQVFVVEEEDNLSELRLSTNDEDM